MSGPPPGVPEQRTLLSWRRTALTLTVVGLLAGRIAVTHAAWYALLLALPSWAVPATAALRRGRALARRPVPGPASAPALTSLGVVGFALVGVLFVILRGTP